MRRRTKVAIAAALSAIVAAGVLLLQTLRYGFSAKDEPSRIEEVMARTMRHYATPSDLRGRRNPLPETPEVLAEAMGHFADHCAVCHGNDGKGQTAMGPNFYPKAPDMTLSETQAQSDGELFATIENGIRLTGMPGWGNGTAESAYGSWTLVHFIRHLPRITAEEIVEMEALNPKNRTAFEQEQEEKRFLEGGGGGGEPASKPISHH